jgi:hypothetical protein
LEGNGKELPFQGLITTGRRLVCLQRGVDNRDLFGWDPHLWINCPTKKPGFPYNYDTISVGPRRLEALGLIPHIPFL